MTFCKLLVATTIKDGDAVTAWELWDKDSCSPRYEITVSRNGIEKETVKAAKTTWKKKYKSMTE